MTILDKIKAQKQKEVALLKSILPVSKLEHLPLFSAATRSLKEAVKSSVTGGIIAEFKRKSPAKGIINPDASIIEVTQGYAKAAVSGLSVLSDELFFGAKPDDFQLARTNNSIPVLRKDFIVDMYQLFESKAMGADVILLIAKILTPKEIKIFTKEAHQLGLEVFLETHNEDEIRNNTDSGFDLIGINNRNLESFEVSIENSIRLAQLLPKEAVKIAESGISSAATIKILKANGFNGFLIGEYFMKAENPHQKCEMLIKELLQ